jgi:hypothetical protein
VLRILIAGGRAVGHYRDAFVGIDVAKSRNAIAIADNERGGEVRYFGEVDAAQGSEAFSGPPPGGPTCPASGQTPHGVAGCFPSPVLSSAEPGRPSGRHTPFATIVGLLRAPIRRHASGVVPPRARTIAASRSLPMMCSFDGTLLFLHGPD